jgi:hypothetical protein
VSLCLCGEVVVRGRGCGGGQYGVGHHDATRPQPFGHQCKDLGQVAAAAADKDAVRSRQGGQNSRRLAVDHLDGVALVTPDIVPDIGLLLWLFFHRIDHQLRAEAGRLHRYRAAAGAHIPQHPLVGELQGVQGNGPDLVLGDQAAAVGNGRALQAKGKGAGPGPALEDHHIERPEGLGADRSQAAPGQPFILLAQVFGHHHLIARRRLAVIHRRKAGQQLSAQGVRAVCGVREDQHLVMGQQQRQDVVGRPAMQRDKTGVVPRLLEAAEGKLHGGEGRQNLQLFRVHPGQQGAADAEKERVAAGQHRHRAVLQPPGHPVQGLLDRGDGHDLLAGRHQVAMAA